MNGLLISLLSLLGLVAIVQCYGGRGVDPLGELLKAQRFKRSVKTTSENLTPEYSPPVYIGPQDGLKEANKILRLPGQPNEVNFAHYSGHVTVDAMDGRALFYYFVESENSSSKPLVLWLNGGPGCSSFGNGAMTELGPFRVNRDGKTLSQNVHAWNNVANVLFLESPAGVGFSYSNASSEYYSGDRKTAEDNYVFLVTWLERFPEYKTRDFFIAGESYAGHYVPQLAQLILRMNKNANQTIINLRGIAIGNAYVDLETQDSGTYDFYWSRDLISEQTHEAIVLNCNFSSEAGISDTCKDYLNQAEEEIGLLDPYNIYAPLCNPSSSTPSTCGFDPCSDHYTSSYLNNPEVQESLHANTTGIPGPWNSCSFIRWEDKPETVLPTIKELTGSGISVWMYSGDTDGVVSVTTTQYAIKKLGLEVETPWYAWYSEGEVGGYAVGYKNLTFVTIRGAGHFVPSYQPARALTFFSSFLDGKLPPSTF